MDEHIKPPPVGVVPRWIHDERRAIELIDVLGRYRDGQHWPHPEWAEELAELLRGIMKRGKPFPTPTEAPKP